MFSLMSSIFGLSSMPSDVGVWSVLEILVESADLFLFGLNISLKLRTHAPLKTPSHKDQHAGLEPLFLVPESAMKSSW